MIIDDWVGLERIEFEAQIDFYRAAPDALRVSHAIGVRRVGAATCLTCRTFEPTSIFRRVVGFGVGQATSEAEIDDALSFMNAQRQQYAVSVSPHAAPSELSTWLETRGFTRGYAWMKFHRQCDAVPSVETDLHIRIVGREFRDVFGSVVSEAFGLPNAIAPWLAALPGRSGWICAMAFAGEHPVAAGAAYVSGEYAWLGFGATKVAHRSRGAQRALLARRLDEAAARGVRVAVTETGERVPGKPSNSYRNILRAGFAEAYLRANFMSAAR